MIFSESWLREWVNPEIGTAELMARLTMAGLEADGCKAVAGGFSGVVVGEVAAVEAHPGSAKLRVCEVDDGRQRHRVVCGAPNVVAGMKAPYAAVGARFDEIDGEPREIEALAIRGVESAGMLCSAAELGMGEDADGLLELPADALPGADIREVLDLDDHSIALDLTPNRGDCLGMLGIARDVGAMLELPVSQPAAAPMPAKVTPDIADEFPVRISAGAQCPRYLGQIVRGIRLDASTPLWMREKLRRSGLRCIDPVVDVTNFVLLELGQPLHAFDLAKLRGHIDVRLAHPGEELTLLDGSEQQLADGTLVIADAEGAVAMAGIMGGLRTAVSEQTVDVFLECAAFSPDAIAGRARAAGMQTDASQRYERGVDHQLQHRALARATSLLLAIAGGEAGPVTEALGELPETRSVSLRFASVRRMLGVEIPVSEVKGILARLGFTLLAESREALSVEVPSFRYDVAIEADLLEELARIHGYNKLPATMGLSRQRMGAAPARQIELPRIRGHLAALGYQEVITYSFIEPGLAARFSNDDDGIIRLANPISSELSVMRGSLMPGLVQTLRHNVNRQQENLRLFETGLVFSRNPAGSGEDFRQQPMLAGLIAGASTPRNWHSAGEAADFYDARGDLESLFDIGGRSAGLAFRAASHPGLHPGQCARVEFEEALVGHLGALHPALQRELELPGTFLFEVCLDALRRQSVPTAQAPSRFPEVSRDIAVVIGEQVEAAAIEQAVREATGPWLESLSLLDVYRGGAVPEGHKSIALGLTWRHPSRTLDDAEVDGIIDSTIKALQEKFNAFLRN